MTFFLIITILVFAIPGYAIDTLELPALSTVSNKIYVNAGSASDLRNKIQNASGGETIVIPSGTYNVGTGSIEIIDFNLTVRGQTGNPEDVIIKGGGFSNCSDVDEEKFVLRNGNITLADFTISESRCHGIKFESSSADNIVIHRVHLKNIGERAIKCGQAYTTSDVEIRYCLFENTKIPDVDRCGAHDSGNYIGGIDVMRADSWKIYNNTFKNIKGAIKRARAAIFMWGGLGYHCDNLNVYGNVFLNCDRSIAFGNANGNDDVRNSVVKNNFIVEGENNALEIMNTMNCEYYHNTIYPPAAINTYLQNNSGLKIKNNINFSLPSLSGIDTARNIIAGGANFEDPNNGDLHLRGTNISTFKGKGVHLWEVNYDFDGDSRPYYPTIGADETLLSCISDCGFSKPEKKEECFSVYPNPFNPLTQINIFSGTNQRVSLNVYDLSGRKVAGMERNLTTGSNIIPLNMSGMASGIYTLRAEYGTTVSSARLMLLE